MRNTDQRASESIARLQAALSSMRQAVGQVPSRSGFLTEVTRVLVESGGFSMAFIGWLQPDTTDLVPLAWWGNQDDAAALLRIFSERCEAALAAGLQSSGIIPVRIAGQCRGVLVVHTPAVDFFAPGEIELLEQVAAEVSSGLEAFDAELQRLQSKSTGAARDRRLQVGLDAGGIGTCDWDLATGKIVWHGQHERLFGFRPGECAGTYASFEERVHAADLPGLKRAVENARETRGPFEREFRAVWPDGSFHWVLWRGQFFYDQAGSAIRMCGAVVDIGARKRALAALLESDERLNQAVRVADLGIFDHDHITGIIYWSPEQRAMHELDGSQPVNLEVYFERVHPDDRERIAAEVRRAHDPEGDGLFDVEHRLLLPDGSVRWTSTRSQTFFADQGQDRHPVRTVGAVRDITERKNAEAEKARLEAQLHHVQKMETVARLGGGVAHDFNNLLMVINGYCDMLLKELDPGDRARESVSEIRRAGQRATELTQQMLAFSRKQISQPKILDLNAVIRDTEKTLLRLIDEEISLTTDLSPGLGSVRADPSQISQALINLAMNGRDAMPNGGHLAIGTRNITLDQDYAKLHPEVIAGAYVEVTVSDSGPGLDAETSAHLFEPFFTTKSEGGASGLGLAIVYGTVRQAGGSISVYSEPGIGTSFKIYLPRIADGGLAAPAPPPVETLRGTETILLVEDQQDLRKMAHRVLASHGYTVIEASAAAEALALSGAHLGPIHLMLTDVVMPGMNGRELAERLHPVRPEMKVVYMSGYLPSAIVQRGVLDADIAFVQKPIPPDDLLLKIRELLAAARK